MNRLADHTGWAHGSITAYAKYGIVLFAVLLVLAALIVRRDGDTRGLATVASAAVASLVAVGIGQIIGNVVDRARPYTAMPAAHVLVARTSDFSFPSDHATAVGAIAIGLLFARRSVGVIACVLAALMAFARVYVGVHYPGDVIAGLVLGGVVAAAVRPLATLLLVPALDYVRTTRLSPLVTSRRP